MYEFPYLPAKNGMEIERCAHRTGKPLCGLAAVRIRR